MRLPRGDKGDAQTRANRTFYGSVTPKEGGVEASSVMSLRQPSLYAMSLSVTRLWVAASALAFASDPSRD